MTPEELSAIVAGMTEKQFQEKIGGHFGGPSFGCTKANFPAMYAANAAALEARVCRWLDIPTEAEKQRRAAKRKWIATCIALAIGVAGVVVALLSLLRGSRPTPPAAP